VIGPHLDMYEWKVGKFPERVNNMYFTLVFLLRAVNKAKPQLGAYAYHADTHADHRCVYS
jgi:hypothetical protein